MYFNITYSILGDTNVMSCPKNHEYACKFLSPYHNVTVNESITFVSPDRWRYHSPNSVLAAWQLLWIFVIYRGDWLSIKCCENDFFRKLFLFFENTFQYLGGISQNISVSHFDFRRSLSLANRRRSTSPILQGLSALLSLVISMTGRSERSARALRDGADVVREAIGD